MSEAKVVLLYEGGTYKDNENLVWTEFEVDYFAEQEDGTCCVCEKPISRGFMCLDGGDEVCRDCVILVGDNLPEFARGYIECALWSSTDDDDELLDKNFAPDDIAPESLLCILTECEDFLAANPVPDYNNPEWSNEELMGHDFWLTRNGHGAGFWDRGLGELGEKLSEAARIYGESDICVGDDGKLYFS